MFRWEEGESLYRYGGSLYTIRPDGTDLTLLSSSIGDGRELGGKKLAFDTSLAVSPDGSRVAYATLRESDWLGSLDIATVRIERGRRLLFFGGNRERLLLTKDLADEESARAPAWSPDGTRVAFIKNLHAIHGYELHTMAADGSDVRAVAPGLWAALEPPAWSPDGSRLAFRAFNDPYQALEDGTKADSWALYVVGTDGSNLTRVAGPVAANYYRTEYAPPAWSPDGRRIAFVAGPRNAGTVQVVNLERGTVRVLCGGDGPLVWSPDGAEVLFFSYSSSSPTPDRGVYAVTADGEPVIRSFAVLNLNDNLGMAWSPDGARLVVSSRPFSVSPDVIHPSRPYADVVLWTVAAKGGDLQVLVRARPNGELVAQGEAP